MHTDQVEKARYFLALHHGDDILVLLNAWDAASARIFQAVGSRAIGTTSMGIAASIGYPDVERIPLEEMVAAVGRIVRAVDIPVTADMEAGYGATPAEVVESIRRVVACGAVGVNLEDGTGDQQRPLTEPAVAAERIAAVREATRADGIHLVINARTDIYLRAVGPSEDRFAEAVARGNAYREAGADCVFVPGGLDRETIRAIVREIDAPINILANPASAAPGVPPVPELAELGVARVSVGSAPMRSTLSFARRIAEEVLGAGSYDLMAAQLTGPEGPRAYRDAIGEA